MVNMPDMYILIIIILLGVTFGSFAGAQIWRLRLRELRMAKRENYEYDKAELRRLEKLSASTRSDRSRCLECGHTLAWYDLLPLLSWMSTGGRCRYCHHPIGWMEPTIELATAGLFVLSYVAWPGLDLSSALGMTQFALWLVACVALVILFFYDVRWSILPDSANGILAGMAALYAAIGVMSGGLTLADLGGALAVLFGVYTALYYVSRALGGEERTWVGFGDVKLVVGLSLLLSGWMEGFIALFLANLIGTLIVVPPLLAGKLSRTAHVPFGPMLIAGALIVFFWGDELVKWYDALTRSLVLT